MPIPINSPHHILRSTALNVSSGTGLLLTSSGFAAKKMPIMINMAPMNLKIKVVSIKGS